MGLENYQAPILTLAVRYLARIDNYPQTLRNCRYVLPRVGSINPKSPDKSCQVPALALKSFRHFRPGDGQKFPLLKEPAAGHPDVAHVRGPGGQRRVFLPVGENDVSELVSAFDQRSGYDEP